MRVCVLTAHVLLQPRQQAESDCCCNVLPLQLDSLTRLSLQDCGCRSFAGLLGYLPSLEVLALPFNKLTSLEGLAQAAPGNKLAQLDVSFNNISAWSSSWLQDCTALTALDASCNHSTQPAELQPLVRCAAVQFQSMCHVAAAMPCLYSDWIACKGAICMTEPAVLCLPGQHPA
jgi:hypothetical protein